MNKNQSN